MPPHTLESVNKVQYNKKESSLFVSSRTYTSVRDSETGGSEQLPQKRHDDSDFK